MGISVKNIYKRFGDFSALENVSLDIQSGELIALLGPSGSGKTTLLRIIAGLEQADAGDVLLNGENTNSRHAGERHVGFVFQHYALFKHMTVFENVAFGLRVRKKDRPEESVIQRRILELLKLVHLDGLHGRYPSQLSGGQRQRVALARALAVEPKVLLLDEPFGALDAKVRKELRRWMRRLHDEIHVTSVFVTHDQEEAMEVADRIVVMSNGRIEQVGTPDEVWNKPANGFVYDFLGNYNAFEGWKSTDDGSIHLTEYDVVSVNPTKETEPEGSPPAHWWDVRSKANSLFQKFLPSIIPHVQDETLPLLQQVTAIRGKGKAVKLYARPHEMVVVTEPDGQEYISAKIIHINPAGSLVKLELERPNGQVIQAEISAEYMETCHFVLNQDVFVRPKKTKVFG